MAQVLYRKYRSQKFDELLGQPHITDLLKNAVKSGKIAHAFLFVGSRGTGKTSTARILAKAVNCLNLTPEGNPCNECSVCKAINSGSFLDMIEIDAASNRGIDQIRELKEKIEFSPSEGKYKVYIIDEVHMLTNEAFNALLKTLEEPPAHVIFILATTDVHKVPATILSRCQRYDFRLGNEAEIRELILSSSAKEGVKLSEGAVKLLVENARGSYRDGLSLLDVVVSGQKESENPKEVTEEEVREVLGIPDNTMVYLLLEKLVAGDGEETLKLIEEINNKGINMQQFTKYVLGMLQEVLVMKIKNISLKEDYPFAENLSDRDILVLINLFLEVEKNLRNTTISTLLFEMLIPQVKNHLNTGSTSVSNSVPVNKTPVKPSPVTPSPVKSEPDKNAGANNANPSMDKSEVQKTEKNTKSDDVKPQFEEPKVQSAEATETKTDISASSTAQPDKGSKPEDQTVEANVEPLSEGNNADLTKEMIEKDWKKLTQEVKPINNRLFALLESAKVNGFADGVLKLDVPFSFHKDRIEDAKSRETIGNIFMNIFGARVKIECNVCEGVRSNTKAANADIVLKYYTPTDKDKKPSENQKPAAGSGNDAVQQNGGNAGQDGKKPYVNKKIEKIFEGM